MARTKKAKPAVKKTAKTTPAKAVKKPVKAAVKAVKPAAKTKKITAKKTTKAVKTTKATKAPKTTKASKAPKIAKATKVTKAPKAAKTTKKVAKAPKAKSSAPISFEKQLKESARQIKAFEKTLNTLHTQVTKAYKQQATLQSKLANTGNKAQVKKLQAELTKLDKNLIKLINAFEDTKTDVITAKLDAEQAEALLAHMDEFENTWLDEIEMRISAIVSSLPNLPEPTEAEVKTTTAEATSEEELDTDVTLEDEEALELDFEQDYPADITSDLESEEMAD